MTPREPLHIREFDIDDDPNALPVTPVLPPYEPGDDDDGDRDADDPDDDWQDRLRAARAKYPIDYGREFT